MNLETLQGSLQDYLLCEDKSVAANVKQPHLGERKRRLDVYGHGYEARLEDTLAEDFPKLLHLMGAEHFYGLTHEYITANPSQHYSLSFYGEKLSAFLTMNTSYENQPWLAELAAFEWAQGMALIAEDALLLTVEQLTKMPQENWPGLKFYFSPDLVLLDFAYNTLQIIEAIDEKRKPPKPKALKKPQPVILCRNQLEVLYRKSSQAEAMMIGAIKNNDNFAEICEKLCKQMPESEVATFSISQIYSWLQAGMLMVGNE